MLTSLALAAPLAHPALGFGFGLLFVIGHIFWFLIIVAITVAIATRRRQGARSEREPWGQGHGYGRSCWAAAQATRGSETTLAERFAQGDIDEKEYRARLEVLRANAPQPPVGPTGPAGPRP